MVIGKDNKITVAVRSAIGMEVPLKKLQDSEFSERVIILIIHTILNATLEIQFNYYILF